MSEVTCRGCGLNQSQPGNPSGLVCCPDCGKGVWAPTEQEIVQRLRDGTMKETRKQAATLIENLLLRLDFVTDENRAQATVIKSIEADNTDLVIEVGELKSRLHTGTQLVNAALRRQSAQLDTQAAAAWLEECAAGVERHEFPSIPQWIDDQIKAADDMKHAPLFRCATCGEPYICGPTRWEPACQCKIV